MRACYFLAATLWDTFFNFTNESVISGEYFLEITQVVNYCDIFGTIHYVFGSCYERFASEAYKAGRKKRE